MRTRMAWLVGVVVLLSGGFLLHTLSLGQDGGLVPASAHKTEPVELKPVAPAPKTASPTAYPFKRDVQKWPPLSQQLYWSAVRGTDWLFRMNGTDGRFMHGYVAALKTPLDGDHPLRQAGAAVALARAARYLEDERYTARARQAVLALLADTAVDPARPDTRSSSLPPMVVNPLAVAGLLVLAVHELPSPAEDVLEQGEQLCAFIRAQQQADGSLRHQGAVAQDADDDGMNYYSGQALYGLMRSYAGRPAPWKLQAARKALPYYRTWWRSRKSQAFVPWHTAAFTEAYLASRDKEFADFVFEMNDWLCDQQYPLLDPRRPLWGGGFMSHVDGKNVQTPPSIVSASCAESLVEACRVARKSGDLSRYQRYREVLERSLQFVNRLQYTEANTQHFADWYRPVLLGAFHYSQQDGNIRIDYTQHAVCALVQYLRYVIE